MSLKSSSRVAPLLLLLFSACSTSSGNGGAAGTTASGAAGTGSGAAGTSNGAAGTGNGAAGTGNGAAGTGNGAAGTGNGAAGTTGAAGTAASGSAGTSVSDAAVSEVQPGDGGIALPPITGRKVRIMVLGSSNEEGTCWRAFLWQKLMAAGVTNFDFVGRNNAGPDCGVPGYDKDSEAHGGTIVQNITADAWLTTFKANPPDIILQHNGGADLLNGLPYMNVLKAYTLSVTQVRMVSPKVIYFAAQHTPQGGANNVADVKVLNAAMVPWGAGITTAESPIVIVDLFTGIDQKVDMSDGTHLNVSGSQKVSDRFLAVLLPLLKP